MAERRRRKSMRRIEFHDREQERKEIMDILDTEPSLITFVYGPINSGKTALITHLIEELPEDYVVFYINLRGKFISNYDDFVRALFKLDREKKEYKEILKTISEVSLKSLKFTGIPITEGVLDLFFREKTHDDVFEFLEDYFMEIAENKVPVLVVDELQKIGDVRINTYLIYELFNLFIRLTKELHLCHVFAVTSDSLFIERVYSEAMLSGRCRYLVVDDFDLEMTMEFLDKYNFSDMEKDVAWKYCGGKPVCLVELVNRGRREEKAREMLGIRTGQIEGLIEDAKEFGYKISYGEKEIVLNDGDILKGLERFGDEEYLKAGELPKPIKLGLIKANILFLDPVKQIIKPQSRLNLLAIREVIKNA
ncbi:MAG: ATP-binding protein [Candidatus Methanogaster sp.]|uniref:ATP-binding protein n=1 Tax=Candidatus Methanogaster sp. TaxID=3386292 RepID=A0AC61L1R0_9EURY|nr:MAG: ATP-binding protein [ANME-2 cluster archaeon]